MQLNYTCIISAHSEPGILSAKKTNPDNSKSSNATTPRKPLTLNQQDRYRLYTRSEELTQDLREKTSFLKFTRTFDDPFLDPGDNKLKIHKLILAPWEPNLTDGPTSSRFAVVDYNSDDEVLIDPARWDESNGGFIAKNELEKDQVSIWALLQRALDSFQHSNALGRLIPWGFDGSRLILVPHAGYDRNAYYDRESKSLQFYYYSDSNDSPIEYTCRSMHIVAHEFGHAILDGIRPRLYESVAIESNAFHEFFGDLVALLVCLQDRKIRQKTAIKTKGDFESASDFQNLAVKLGNVLLKRPYLRSFKNKSTMRKMAGSTSHHDLSEVLSGAVFDILEKIGKKLSTKPAKKPKTPKEVFWNATNTIRGLTLQSLDLLPPVDIHFRDYAFAICGWYKFSNPVDSNNILDLLSQSFKSRGIFDLKDVESLKTSQDTLLKPFSEIGTQPSAQSFERLMYRPLRLEISRNIERIIESRESAYRLVDDNREQLLIPLHCDVSVADLYETYKFNSANEPLGTHYVLQYLWREDVQLIGERFAQFDSKHTVMLCGGTLVFDQAGKILSWSAKPGSKPYTTGTSKPSRTSMIWKSSLVNGKARRKAYLDDLARQIANGQVGNIIQSPLGMLGKDAPSLVAKTMPDGSIEFQRSPHGHLRSDSGTSNTFGQHTWEISF
jgi:hypothetical protein